MRWHLRTIRIWLTRSRFTSRSDSKAMNSPQRKFPTTFQKKTENNVLKDHYDPPMCLLMLHMIGNTRIIGQEEFHSPLKWVAWTLTYVNTDSLDSKLWHTILLTFASKFLQTPMLEKHSKVDCSFWLSEILSKKIWCCLNGPKHYWRCCRI